MSDNEKMLIIRLAETSHEAQTVAQEAREAVGAYNLPPPVTSDILDLLNVVFVHGYVAGMGRLLDFLDTKETEAAYSIKKGCDVA